MPATDPATIALAVAIAQALGDDAPVVSSANTPSGCEASDGRPVIVRSRDAGVLFGNFAGQQGDTIHLTDARQMWRWKASKGGTLVDCAVHGVDETGCKFSTGAASVTVLSACALIDCTQDAARSLRAVVGQEWK